MFWLFPPLPLFAIPQGTPLPQDASVSQDAPGSQVALAPQVNMFPVVPLEQRVLIGAGIGGAVGIAYTLPTLVLAGPALASGLVGGGFGAFVQTNVTQATGNPIAGFAAGISAGAASGAGLGFLLGGPPGAIIGSVAGSVGTFIVSLLP